MSDINSWLEFEEMRDRRPRSRDEELMQFFAPPRAPEIEVVTAPRGWSQTTVDSLAAAGYGPDEGYVPLTGAFEGDPDDPRATASIDQAIREEAERVARERADMRREELPRSTVQFVKPPEPEAPQTATVTRESDQAGQEREGFWDRVMGGVRDAPQNALSLFRDDVDPAPTPILDAPERPDNIQRYMDAEQDQQVSSGGILGALFGGPSTTLEADAEALVGNREQRLAESARELERLEARAEGRGTPYPQLDNLYVDPTAEEPVLRDEVDEEYLDQLIEVDSRIGQMDRARQTAEDLGLDPDQGPGMLVRGLDLLARPQRAVAGFQTGMAGNELGSFEQGEGSWEEALGRARSQFTGETSYDYFDTDAFEITDEHRWWEKGGRGLTGFIANVGTDPLTYLTLGTASLGRRAVSELAERSASTAASRAGFGRLSAELGDEAKERLLRNFGDDGVFAAAAAQRADQIRVAGRNADVARGAQPGAVRATDPADVLAQVETVGRRGVVDALDAQTPGFAEVMLRDGLENMAGGSRFRYGSTGLRRELNEVFGTDDVFNAMPVEARGGLQLTVPFASRGGEFGREAYTWQLTKGGSRVQAPASDAVNAVRSAMSSTGAGQRWQHMFAGRDREAVKAMTVALNDRASEGIAGQAYQMFRRQRDANLLQGEWSANRATRTHAAGVAVASHLTSAGDELTTEAQAAMRAAWNQRGSRTYDFDGAVRGLNPDAVAAGRAAEQSMHDMMNDAFRELREVLPGGMLQNYTPRRLASEVAEQLQVTRGRAAKGGTDSLAKRRTGEFADIEITPQGQVQIKSWMSPEEITEEASRRGSQVRFNEDPIEVFADYMDSVTHLTRKNRHLAYLENHGLIQRPAVARQARLSDEGMADAMRPVGEAIGDASRAGRRLSGIGAALRGGDDLTEAIDSETFTRGQALLGEAYDVIGSTRAEQILDGLPRATVRRSGDRWTTTIDDGPAQSFDTFDQATNYANRVTLSETYDQVSDAVISTALSDRRTLNETMNIRNAPIDDPDALAEWMADLTDIVGRWANTNPREFRNAITKNETIYAGYRARLQDAGWENLSDEARDAVAARALGESGALAPASVAKTLAEHYRRSTMTPESLELIDVAWQPFYTSFKTLATVGRGPGFSIRNAGGGMWNGILNGANRSHFSTASRMMNAEHAGRKAAMRELGSMETVPEPDEALRIVQDNIRAQFNKTFKGKGDRLYDALDAFYARNLMSGSRTDDISQQTAAQTTQSANRMAGGPRTASMAGDAVSPGESGPIGRAREGLVNTARMSVGMDARPAGGTRGQVINRMDPGMQRLLEFDQTVFTGLQRSELNRAQRAVQALSDNPWVRGNASLAEVSERYTRLAPFLKGLDDFGLEDGGRAAGLLVKASQFDYGDLSNFERRIMRNLLPFYTFTRNNVPFQVRGAISNPDKLARLGHTWNAVEETLSEDRWEDRLLPRWVRDNLGFVTNVSPQDIGEGPLGGLLADVPVLQRMFDSPHPIAVNLSTLPVTDLEKVFGPSFIDEGISMLNPLVKTPIENVVGVDSFTRGALPDTETLPNFMQGEGAAPFVDAIPGMKREAASGEAVVNARAIRSARNLIPTVSQAERLFGSTDRYKDRMFTSWASNMAGAPVSTLDPFQVRSSAWREDDRLNAEIRRLGVTPGVARDAIEEFGAPTVQRALETPGLLEYMISQMEDE